MTTDRFHKAARDGYLDALKEATRKDLNQKDEDGMTPTLWASFEGNLDALRLIVSRGGDADKCDNYGNTALHFAAARGHLHCVTFLVNFGVNMWALDIDFHTPKDLAAINNKDEILRFLDGAMGKEEDKDRKKVKSYKEKAAKDAEKRVKEFVKLEKKATKSAEEVQRKLSKKREKMEKSGGLAGSQIIVGVPGEPNPGIGGVTKDNINHPLAFLSLKRSDARSMGAGNNGGSASFSQLTNSTQVSGKVKGGTGVYKKIQQRKTLSSAKVSSSDFKVGDMTEGGKRSIRSIAGLRRDNEVMYVPKYEISGAGGVGKRGKITGLFQDELENVGPGSHRGRISMTSGGVKGGSEPEDEREDDDDDTGPGDERLRGLSRSSSQPEYLHEYGNGPHGSESTTSSRGLNGSASIFERPGFGSVAFRKNMNTTFGSIASFGNGTTQPHHHTSHSHNGHGRVDPILIEEEDDGDERRESVASSASSFRAKSGNDSKTYTQVGDDASLEGEEYTTLDTFLAAANLMDYAHIFRREKIDLENLLLLTDEDFKELGIELGPRRKLLGAILERHTALEKPGVIADTRL